MASETRDPERIYLQPECCATPDVGWMWCDTDAPVDCEDGVPWTEYVRADLDAADPLRAMLPEVVAGFEELRDKFVGVLSYRDEVMDEEYAALDRSRDLLARLRTLTPTEGGTDDGQG